MMATSSQFFGTYGKGLNVARNVQKKRFEKIDGINSNAQMNRALLKEYCQAENEGQKLLQRAHDRFQYSAPILGLYSFHV
jgi:predicted ATPase with chaperone activity